MPRSSRSWLELELRRVWAGCGLLIRLGRRRKLDLELDGRQRGQHAGAARKLACAAASNSRSPGRCCARSIAIARGAASSRARVPQQGAGAAQRLQVGARRGPADVLRGHSRLPPRLQSVCGSPIVNWAEPNSPFVQRNPQILTEYGIALATLDDDPGVRPACHIFVRSKAPWFEITDELPQYPEYPPPA